MPLSNWNNENNKTFINLKLVAEVWPTDIRPLFYKVDSNFALTNETFSNVEGKLVKVKWTHTPAKGRMGDIYWFKAFVEDGEFIYVLESTITNASKSLLNSLLPSKDKDVKISLYLNKNGYPTASVKVGEDFAEQFMDYKAIDNIALYDAIEKFYPTTKEEELTAEDIPF